jgi:hypothetical protein
MKSLEEDMVFIGKSDRLLARLSNGLLPTRRSLVSE